MDINKNIFKEYDIRGIYPDEIEMNGVYRIAGAFVKFLETEKLFGPIVVGRDARLSSPELHEVCMQAVLDQGHDVYDIGEVSTPLFYFSVRESKAAGGAMITASHNPKEYNGIKLVKEGAIPLGFERGIGVIREFAMQDIPRKQSQGKVIARDYASKYVEFLKSHANISRPVKFVVDASNGSAGEVIRRALTGLQVEYKALFFKADGNFPNHPPNPHDEASIKEASYAVITSASEFGVIIDGDGDRIAFLDENGKRVRSDVVGAYLVDNLLQKGDRAVTTKNATKAFRDAVMRKGGEVVFSRVGHSNVKKVMREKDAVFSAEPSGHVYFKDFGYADSSLLALVHLLSFFSQEEKKFSETMKPYCTYFNSGELNFPVADRDAVIARLKEIYKDGMQDEFDGLTVEYSHSSTGLGTSWWFNVRPSHTEPLLRLTIEADTKEIVAEKQAELEKKINEQS